MTTKRSSGATSPAKTKRPSTRKKATGPSLEDVARRAYEIYVSRGGNHGADFDDWLEAERQLKAPKKARKA